MKLSDYSSRALNAIASTIAQTEVRIVLTKQIPKPICIAIGPRTIALDPAIGALDDLIVAAIIVATFRRSVRESGDRSRLVRANKNEWIAKSVAKLREMFPKSGNFFKDRYKLDITWDQIRFCDHGNSNDQHSSTTLESVSGVRFVGNNAITSFLAQLAAGTYPLEQWAGLDMPVARLPMDLSHEMSKNRELEILEDAIKDAKQRTSAIMTCFVRKCIGKLQNNVRVSHHRTGTNLDMNRIVRAVIDSSLGTSSSHLYKVRKDQRDRVFHPNEHHVLQAIDLGSIQNHINWYGYSPELVAVVGEGFRHLQVGHSILLFADQVIEQNGKRFYIHMPIKLKAFEESMQNAMVRLAMLCSHRLGKMVNLGKTIPFVCWQPLQLETAFRELQRVDKKSQTDYQTLMYINTRSIQAYDSDYCDPTKLSQAAECIEDTIKAIEKHGTETKTIDLDFLYLDPNIISNSRKGSRVARSISLV